MGEGRKIFEETLVECEILRAENLSLTETSAQENDLWMNRLNTQLLSERKSAQNQAKLAIEVNRLNAQINNLNEKVTKSDKTKDLELQITQLLSERKSTRN